MAKVQVEQGQLEGEVVELVTGDGKYYSFKGIPYAAPPIGELRFKDPQPLRKWDGVRKATSHGFICRQKDLFSGIVPSNGSEDCLYLNVYSPNLTPKTPLAVMVFIHGGGFLYGSGNSDIYGPDFLVKNDVIVVTINYRLGVLGFICLDIPEAPGNAGLKDQVAALKWINKNISAFGGDPNNVTLFGDSVGSACVALHVLSPMSKDLFHRAIIMSDTPFGDAVLPFNPQKRAFTLGKQLGFSTQDPYELLNFLRNVPADKLLINEVCIIASEVIMAQPFKMFSLVPVIEKNFGQNAFLLEEPMKILLSGDINVRHVLSGYTTDEAIAALAVCGDSFALNYEKYPEMFVPRRIVYEKSANTVLSIAEVIVQHYFGKKSIDNILSTKEFVKYLSDVTFTYHIHKFLKGFYRNKETKCYLYKFSGYSERNIFGNQKEKYNITGVSHYDDLMYLFHGKIYNLPFHKENKSYKIIEQTCALFTNFAKCGDPTPDSSLNVVWPQYDDENEGYLDIGEELVPGKAADADVIEFWDRIHEIAKIPYGYLNMSLI